MSRARFQLPRKPQHDPVESPDTGCLVDQCLACEGQLLDAHANHAQTCPLARKSVHTRHYKVEQVVRQYASEAGYTVEREVSAAELLVQNLADGAIADLIPGARPDERRMDIVLKDPIR